MNIAQQLDLGFLWDASWPSNINGERAPIPVSDCSYSLFTTWYWGWGQSSSPRDERMPEGAKPGLEHGGELLRYYFQNLQWVTVASMPKSQVTLLSFPGSNPCSQRSQGLSPKQTKKHHWQSQTPNCLGKPQPSSWQATTKSKSPHTASLSPWILLKQLMIFIFPGLVWTLSSKNRPRAIIYTGHWHWQLAAVSKGSAVSVAMYPEHLLCSRSESGELITHFYLVLVRSDLEPWGQFWATKRVVSWLEWVQFGDHPRCWGSWSRWCAWCYWDREFVHPGGETAPGEAGEDGILQLCSTTQSP